MSLLLAHGAALHIMREIADHSDIKVTMTVYAHGNLNEHVAALARHGTAIGETLPSTIAVNEATEEEQSSSVFTHSRRLPEMLTCGCHDSRDPRNPPNLPELRPKLSCPPSSQAGLPSLSPTRYRGAGDAPAPGEEQPASPSEPRRHRR